MRGYSVGSTDERDLYAIQIVSGGMVYILVPSFITIGSGIQAILWLLRQQFEGLQCLY
jgi:hypothetical protein